MQERYELVFNANMHVELGVTVTLQWAWESDCVLCYGQLQHYALK